MAAAAAEERDGEDAVGAGAGAGAGGHDACSPDWLYRARYRAIRRYMATPPVGPASTHGQLRRPGAPASSSAMTPPPPPQPPQPGSAGCAHKDAFCLCVRVVRSRLSWTSPSLASWVFNAEITEQAFTGDEREPRHHAHIFTALTLDPESFLLFRRSFSCGRDRDAHARSGRILAPFDDLPWLVGQPTSVLRGKQLRIVVYAVYPVTEKVVDTVVQY